MVLHDVPQRPDRVVEAPPVVHTEVLGHGDLDALDVVAVPERLEDGVGEPEEQDVHRRFLAEEMVDPVDLPFLEVPVQLGVQRPGRGQVVAEGLLHRDPGPLGETGPGQALHHAAEQRRRDLEIEDGAVPPLDGVGDAVIGLRVLVVARDHRQALGQPLENMLADLLAGVFDGLARVVAEGRGRPLVAGYADDRALKLLAALHAVQGPEGLLFRQVPGDAEDHQDVGGRGRRSGHLIPLSWPLGEGRAHFTAGRTAPPRWRSPRPRWRS